jgi:hypothetical protein
MVCFCFMLTTNLTCPLLLCPAAALSSTPALASQQPKNAKPHSAEDASIAAAEVSHRYNQVYKVWQNRSADANATYTITVAELNNATASKLGGPKYFNKLVLLSIRDADSTKANIAVAADGQSLTVSPVPSRKGHIKNVIPIVFEGVANGTLPARGGKHQPAVPPAGPFNATGLIELLLCECLALLLLSLPCNTRDAQH